MKPGADASVDIHTHVVPEHFPAYLGSRVGARWPSTAPAQPCHRHVMLDGKVYRTVSHQCWDCAVRLADMESMGIGMQVLSPMPELLSYWLDPQDGQALSRFLNESIAEMASAAPGRLLGLGTVPLQDVARAIEELDHLLHRCGLAGVEIGSNIDGVALGDPRLAPFFEAAESWGAAIFVHALRPTGMERLVGPPILEQVLAFPGEVGLAAASLLTGGTLARYPRLRIALSHGGGTLAQLLPRLQFGWEVFPALRDAISKPPGELARQFYVDDLVYDARTIQHLIATFGATQVMVGSDYPFSIMDREPTARVLALGLEAAVQEMLLGANAWRWLGWSEG